MFLSSSLASWACSVSIRPREPFADPVQAGVSRDTDLIVAFTYGVYRRRDAPNCSPVPTAGRLASHARGKRATIQTAPLDFVNQFSQC